MIDGGLRRDIVAHLPAWDWQPVETGGISPGVPDLNGCRAGREVWVECKATTGWVVKFRPLQPAWILRRTAAGGHVFVVVLQRRRTGDMFYVYQGAAVLALQAHGLRLESWLYRGPAPPDWLAVDLLLQGESVS
jgi:hypothetical protein